jgi:hypothetical protein
MRSFTVSISVFLFLVGFASSFGSDDVPRLIITNLKVEPVEGKKTVKFSWATTKADEATILYDIERSNKSVGFLWRHPVYHAKKAETSDVKRILGDEKHVLLHVHGFGVKPADAMKGCADYNKRADPKYFAIPVVWDTTKGDVFKYGSDRRELAPEAGKAFADLLDLIMMHGSSRKWSIMCHSMGNYVLRTLAQLRHVDAQENPEPRKAVFENIFMVAADVRADLFHSDINDYDPHTYPEIGPSTYLQVYIQSPKKFDIGKKNPGLDIASLAKNTTHVLWSRKDKALLARRSQKRWVGVTDDGKKITTKALGANGDRDGKILEQLKALVDFHKCDSFNRESPIFHGYHWSDGAIKIYEEAIGGS